MGDSGSMFIGFFLASTALINLSGGRSRSFLPVLAVPILVLFIPIFDTTFVTILRKLSGRAASQGGRDHTSHRLVALGMSERRAVWMRYGLAAVSGLLAVAVRELRPDVRSRSCSASHCANAWSRVSRGLKSLCEERRWCRPRKGGTVFWIDFCQRESLKC